MGLSAGSVVLVSFRGGFAGQRVLFTHTYRVLTAGAAGTSYAQEMAALLNRLVAVNQLWPKWLACLPNNFSGIELRAQAISPVRQVAIVRPQPEPGTFNAAGQIPNISAAVTLRTALAGRAFVATKHIGPVAESAVEAGFISDALNTPLAEFKNAAITDVVPSGFDVPTYRPVIFHRNPKPGQPSTTDVISGAVQDTSRVMRRRTVRVGE